MSVQKSNALTFASFKERKKMKFRLQKKNNNNLCHKKVHFNFLLISTLFYVRAKYEVFSCYLCDLLLLLHLNL